MRRATCLNLGCGKFAADGWLNIDASPYLRLARIPGVARWAVRAAGGLDLGRVVYGDIVRGLNVDEESAELVFASHVLEHLSRPDFHVALDNICTYTKAGGLVRIIVPDLLYFVETYQRSLAEPESSSRAADAFMELSGLGAQNARTSVRRRAREAFSNARHQWMWDRPSLVSALADHGFKDCRVCGYGEWRDPRFAAVEVEARHVHSICVEAAK